MGAKPAPTCAGSVSPNYLALGVPGATPGSLNLGSINFADAVYRNSPTDIWLEQTDKTTVKPSLEVVDTGYLAFTRSLVEQVSRPVPLCAR